MSWCLIVKVVLPTIVRWSCSLIKNVDGVGERFFLFKPARCTCLLATNLSTRSPSRHRCTSAWHLKGDIVQDAVAPASNSLFMRALSFDLPVFHEKVLIPLDHCMEMHVYTLHSAKENMIYVRLVWFNVYPIFWSIHALCHENLDLLWWTWLAHNTKRLCTVAKYIASDLHLILQV